MSDEHSSRIVQKVNFSDINSFINIAKSNLDTQEKGISQLTKFTIDEQTGYCVAPNGMLTKQGELLLNYIIHYQKEADNLDFKTIKKFFFDSVFKVKDDSSGSNILHFAVFVGREKFSLEIIEKATTEQLLTQNYIGDTALHIAVRGGYIGIIDALLEKGGNKLTVITNSEGKTALHLAVEVGDQEMAIKLIERMPPKQLLVQGDNGLNILDLAIKLKLNDVIASVVNKVPYNDIKKYKNNSAVSELLKKRAKSITVGEITNSIQNSFPTEEIAKRNFNVVR